MSDHLITRVGAALDDGVMTLYDHKAKASRTVDWARRDRGFALIKTALEQSAGSWAPYAPHVIPERTPVSSQGNAGSCVANAWCDAMEILDGLVGADKVEQLSRRFLYWTSRYLHGATDVDDGTYVRAAAHQLRKVGIFEEKWFEYSDQDDHILSGGKHASPAVDHYTMASNNRLDGFYRLTSGGDQFLKELELVVRANHPAVFGTSVSKAFTQYRGGGTIWMPPDDPVGKHAMIVTGVGYDEGRRWWLLRNSWSKAWGDDGHCKVSDEYALEFEDVWVGTRMKADLT